MSASARRHLVGGRGLGMFGQMTSRVAVLASSSQASSAGTVSDRVFSEAEQILPRLGVNVEDPRLSLALALGAQAGRKVEQGLQSLVGEVTQYTTGARRVTQPANWEEALMTVPDLETIPYKVVERVGSVEIREVESFLVAETRMMAKSQGFDFMGSSQAFNTLAGYLFGKNKSREAMEMTTPVISSQGAAGSRSTSKSMDMTTPVITSRAGSGTAMEMTTPVINTQGSDSGWSMSFVIPSEFNEFNIPLPDDPSVIIRRIPAKTVAVAAFPGYVTDDEVARRERMLRDSVAQMQGYQIAPDAKVEVSQYNPPFTLPFQRRNEVSLEVLLQ